MSYRPMAFFSELVANASAKNVAIVLYSGNDDALVGHRSTQSEEATLSNTYPNLPCKLIGTC